MSFNTKEELRETLTTLTANAPLAASLELRISVLDNASSDGSPEMVKQAFPQVTLVRSETNLGFGPAMNELAARSSADYLLLLNSDVVVAGDLISPLVRELERNPLAIVAGPRLVWPGGQIQYSANHFPTLPYEYARLIRDTRLGRLLGRIFDYERIVRRTHRVDETHELRSPWEPDSIWATCWLMRRADIAEHGLFDKTFSLYDEDLDFCRRAKRRGRRMLYVPGVELVHVGGASSTSNSKAEQMSSARRRYYLRHHGWLAAALYSTGIRLLSVLARGVEALAREPRRSVG